MRLPLYKEARAGMETRNHKPKEAHTGLWYEKFCNRWSTEEWDISGTEKLRWITTVTDESKKDNHYSRRIESYMERFLDLVEKQQGKWSLLKTEGRFVTGMGRPHPVENGFSWHPTLGIPYIPGSSIKGMVRNWVEIYLGIGEDEINRIFGSKKPGTSHAGSVIFFDAIPIDVVKLEADIMTPHYTEYYQDKKNPPADWYSPVPIPFLTVAPDQTFLFAVAPRLPEVKQEEENGETDVEKVMKWMIEALEWIGAGAKTAVGYGRFIVDKSREDEWRKERKQAKMSPIRREMEEDGYDDANDNLFMEKINKKWLTRIVDETNITVKQEIAQYLKEWYLKRKSDQWRKPNKKNTPKINQIKDALGEL